MATEEIIGALFALSFGGLFLLAVTWAFVELVGRIYGTYRCFVRDDLSSEQRIIYLLLIWFIPFGWLIYFILGTEKTQQLFAEAEFL